MAEDVGALEALDLTHVLYNPASSTSLALALATLSPILLMACYGALTLVTRDALILNMWLGQLACEGFNGVLKSAYKEGRPDGKLGNGYGWPSSHSQFMGYFSSFLILHIYFRHRFDPTGFKTLDQSTRLVAHLAILGLAGAVCYSRYYLNYHTPPQVLWGYAIGSTLGSTHYLFTELWPVRHPDSTIGRLRRWILSSSPATWFRLKDGWAVWDDGGHGDTYRRWREEWDAKRTSSGRVKAQ